MQSRLNSNQRQIPKKIIQVLKICVLKLKDQSCSNQMNNKNNTHTHTHNNLMTLANSKHKECFKHTKSNTQDGPVLLSKTKYQIMRGQYFQRLKGKTKTHDFHVLASCSSNVKIIPVQSVIKQTTIFKKFLLKDSQVIDEFNKQVQGWQTVEEKSGDGY